MSRKDAFFNENKPLIILLTVLAVLLAVIIAAGLITGRGRNAYVEPAVPVRDTGSDGGVVINELMVKNRSVLMDEDGSFPDWIELKNISPETVSMRGWSISDEDGSPGWKFPDISLAPGECLLIFASGTGSADTLHTDFSLSCGETLSLYNGAGQPVSTVVCEEAAGDISPIRDSSGGYRISLYPTPGRDNTSEEYENLQSESSRPGPLIINEAMVFDPGSGYDWAEIKNISDSTVNLGDYCLSDDSDQPFKLSFPSEELLPGEIRLVYLGGYCPGGDIFGDFSLDSASDNLYISDKDGSLSDWISLKDIPYMCSCGRLPGENGCFYMDIPTPGAENISGFRRVSEKPELISGGGISDGKVSVELSGKGKIYYTDDGSRPCPGSKLYTGPVAMKETGVLRAVSVEDGAMPSRVLDVSCIINEGHSLPVLSLVADSAADFESMYSSMEKGLELPASLSLFDGDAGFSIPCGVRMHGETSLVLPKKNMSVRFRGAYGEKKLNYDIYGGGVTEFTNLVMRAGQDFYGAVIRNELCQNLSLSFSDSLISQRSRYCVLYINGVYSGIYSLMEKPNEQHYASLAGVSRSSVSAVEAEASPDSDFYQEVLSFCASNDMRVKENYEEFCRRVDVDSLIDWIVMEGFCENHDLTSGNVRYCRSTENDGKWRLMFYDLDNCFHDRQGCFYNILSYYYLHSRQVSEMIAPLMENEEFRVRLLKRAAEALRGPLSSKNIISEVDALAAQIRPEIERDYGRFDMGADQWEWNIDYIKALFEDDLWQESCIDALCELFGLSSEERTACFG